MTASPGPERPEPGDTRPRTLAAPPGDRYQPVEIVPPEVVEHPDRLRSIALGLASVVPFAIGYGLLRSVLDLSVGTLALSALGGWLIGYAVQWGAWSGRPHRPSGWTAPVAVGIAFLAWVAGLVASWLVALWVLPGSTRTFEERLMDQPLLDWLGPQLGVLELVQLVLLAGVAWVAARSGEPAGS
jgi:hypothetical protein